MDIRFIPASLDFFYEEVNESNKAMFQEEYNTLNEYSSDDIKDWLKKLKARGELETDKILLTLLVELHKKIDNIEAILKNKEQEGIKLQHSSKIVGIHFEYIKTNSYDFLEDRLYYAKIFLPVFPKREIPLYLLGVTPNIAKINLISQKNQEDWNLLVTSKEREEIRRIKGGK